MADWRDRCAELAAGYGMPEGAGERLAALLELLAADPHSPSSVVEPSRAVDVHLADSLSGLELEGLASARTVADVGSGAGFPGIPLALAMPSARVDLIESATRKCEFLERAVAVADATNAAIVNRRAEIWAAEQGAERYQAVVVRAVAGLATLLEYASPLLSQGGLLVAWKGGRDAAEERAADAASRQLGLRLLEVRPVRPYPASRDRHLHVFEKQEATPAGFPRRAGLAANRPIAP